MNEYMNEQTNEWINEWSLGERDYFQKFET